MYLVQIDDNKWVNVVSVVCVTPAPSGGKFKSLLDLIDGVTVGSSWPVEVVADRLARVQG